MKNLIGQTLGQYKIVKQIGEGGMATVFKAYQPGLNRDVALKILPPYVAEKEGFTERFAREAQAIGNLHHPNILPVYDSGQDKGYGYIAMRYVPNADTLAKLMKHPLPAGQILELTSQIAGALEHAHQAGIIHRDIKPSNILMDKDWVLLSDFGLAKMVETPSELTGTGVGLGTPAYMSPEQAKGEKIDHRTDIYALGIIVFEMLTGQVPHKAETPLATVVKRINEPMPMPRSLNPDIPESVERVLLKVLAINPADRYDSAESFAQGLRTAYNHMPTQLGAKISQDVNVAVPMPDASANLAAAPPIATPEPFSSPKKSGNITPLEVVVITLLGLVGVCGVGGAILSFIPNSNTGETNLAMAPACMGVTFAAVTSVLMIWIRDRHKSASALLALGIIFWFVGVTILGFGGFAAVRPDDNNTFAQNLGYSLALCFAPGGFFALLGLGFYGYDFRKDRHTASLSDSQIESSTGARQARQEKLRRAKEYRTHIISLIKQKKGSNLANQLSQIIPRLDQWQRHLQQLVNRINEFEANRIIQRDLREVQPAITRLQEQLEHETNAHVRQEIAETLAKQKEHKRQLDSLVTVMRRTEFDIDETLAAIGAIYSQLQLLGAKEVDSSRARRLSADVNEQANRLEDILSAMDDVYESTTGL